MQKKAEKFRTLRRERLSAQKIEQTVSDELMELMKEHDVDVVDLDYDIVERVAPDIKEKLKLTKKKELESAS